MKPNAPTGEASQPTFDPSLSSGNSAKLYCLTLLDRWLARQEREVTILDLGCGRGGQLFQLLKRHGSKCRYIGVEPDPRACEEARQKLAGLNVEIRNTQGEHARCQADIVISFSVLEHVYNRNEYIREAMSSLAPDGLFFINYDSGHFVDPGPRSVLKPLSERWKNRFGPILARFGHQQYYQALVPEAYFQDLVRNHGGRIIDSKCFNTDLKSVFKTIPVESQPWFMREWLRLELELNSKGIAYTDQMAKVYRTRNFIITRSAGNPDLGGLLPVG